jgi:hypothetical protein
VEGNSMKLTIVLAFSLIISAQSFAQVPSRDFFPLTVGNIWTYKYYDLDDEAPGDFLNKYYGTGTYRIISKSLSVDSTIWHFEQVRNLTHFFSFNGESEYDTTTSLVDTTFFELVEYNSDNHRVVIPSVYIYPFSFLCWPFSDSLQFSRYAPDTLKDTLSINRHWTNYLWRVNAQFQEQVGMIQFTYTNDYPTGHMDTAADTLLSSILMSVPRSTVSLQPQDLILNQNFPNPFNPSTTISFVTNQSSKITLKIYNLLGQPAETLFDGTLPPGNHSLIWHTSKQSSGVYFCVVTCDEAVKSTKLVLIK